MNVCHSHDPRKHFDAPSCLSKPYECNLVERTLDLRVVRRVNTCVTWKLRILKARHMGSIIGVFDKVWGRRRI